MNVIELAGFASPIAGAVVGAVVGRKAGPVGLAIGIPVGLVIGLGCYFGLVGLSVVVGKLAGFGRDERETTRKSVVGLLTIIAMWMAPLFSAIVTEFAVSLIVRHLAH